MQIKKTTAIDSPRITALIYGPSGIGKTTLAKSLGPRTLVISAESGLLSLRGSDVSYVPIEGHSAEEKYQSLIEISKFLREPNQDFDTIFIDSLTEIGQIFVELLKKKYPEKKDSLNLWGEYAEKIRGFIKMMRDLSSFNVIMTALEQTEKDDIGRRFKLPDLNGKIAQQLPQFLDEVFYYNYVESEDGKKRVLHTEVCESFVAKDRSGKLLAVEQPNLTDIFNKIKG